MKYKHGIQTRSRLDMPLTIKAVSETGEFEGYGSVFGVKDTYGDIVTPGAFAESLKVWGSKKRLPAMLWQHRMDEPIGIFTDMYEDETGLFVKGRLLVEDDPMARRAHAHMKAGSISGMSIGYILKDWEYDKTKEAYILKHIELWEVSLVTFPANDEARVAEVKSALSSGDVPAPSLVERCLRDAGFSRTQAKTIVGGGYKALRDAGDTNKLDSLNSLLNVFGD
ncbi:MAG: HK97 family phage prohead protease [Rheinheimera sp.]|uniref:HK97 family phage prohead protease n=1 Tax=Arsukibacterium sp. UBA3155 TaxID=1946058 RepID=UPI000C946D53|nr:HK97 family phage prohead protease [Arsukibacterium sp. UBA3155]MAD75155.1 HK97 family phage prohead protease [Rheinheimera sp.]|tara:strand:- start:36754 stop:37425 length:672 start_codon:yes stop_codon:yes gene_type:complete